MSPFDLDRFHMRIGGFGRLRSLGLVTTDAEGYSPDYALWSMLDKERVGGFRFSRNAVVGEMPVRFFCEEAHLAVDILNDEHEIRKREDVALDARLCRMGIKVLRFSKEEILMGQEGVRNTVLQELLERRSVNI